MERGKVDQFVRRTPGAISGVLYGTLPNKSNSRRVFRLAGGRTIVSKSAEAIDFVDRVKQVATYSKVGEPLVGATSEKDFLHGVPLLYLKTTVYGESFLRDLDVELLCDALQHAGLINNDRAIRGKFYWWELDKENPRVVFEIGYAERETRQ